MKKWNAPEVAELNINETADGWFPALYEGITGDCLCGNDTPHGVCGPHGEEETGKNEQVTPETDYTSGK
ncbi:MAG: hypothetical protein IKT67_00550 [Lachnospiraceae bacterium]|nr:hypothetical protein [Lachnospiraceae bacterium]